MTPFETWLKEEWRPVVGYEGKYEVSNLGNVRRLAFTDIRRNRWGSTNLYRVKATTMGQRSHDGRYICVSLQTKNHPIHRLVALAFIPNPHKKPFVNHIDANGKNNCVNNLEWCTALENMQHASSLGLMNDKRSIKLTKEIAAEIKSIPIEVSSLKLGKIYNVNSRTIRRIRQGQIWKYA